MGDPLSEVIALLRPSAVFSRAITAAGRWGVRYARFGYPSFCAVLEGSCLIALERHKPVTLLAGDFVLLPATPSFTLSGFEPFTPKRVDPKTAPSPAEVRYGTRTGKPEVRLLGGYFIFESPDAALLVSLLPTLMHLRGVERLTTLVRLVSEESKAERPGRELVLARLVEVLLIEALRASPGEDTPPGLLRGLADERVTLAMRHMHGEPARPWTVELLAKKAALSRSAFYERFTRAVGMAPMEYLLAWRMAIAKDLLRGAELGIAEIAERVGLWLGEHVQHRLQPACGPGTGALHEGFPHTLIAALLDLRDGWRSAAGARALMIASLSHLCAGSRWARSCHTSEDSTGGSLSGSSNTARPNLAASVSPASAPITNTMSE
jgi:AraC-like DNA-binding protein